MSKRRGGRKPVSGCRGVAVQSFCDLPGVDANRLSQATVASRSGLDREHREVGAGRRLQ